MHGGYLAWRRLESRASWESILEPHGWKVHSRNGDETRWVRPDKSQGTSATTGHNAGLHVFTSSAPPFKFNGTLSSKFGAFTWLNHGGDFKAAASALVDLGYGTSTKAAKRRSKESDKKADGASQEPEDETQAETLLRLASDATLFRDPSGRAYAAVPVGDHVEVYAVRSNGFSLWLKRQFYNEKNRPPSVQSFQDALGVLEAQAIFDGPEESVHVRIAGDAERILLDLGDTSWRVVEINAAGCTVLDKSPVRFRRPSGMRSLPIPERGGSLDLLRNFANIDPDDFILLMAWLAAALSPTGPYPVLVLTGEYGAAKSTLRATAEATDRPPRLNASVRAARTA